MLVGQGMALVLVNLWLLTAFFVRPFPATNMYRELGVRLSTMEVAAIEYAFLLPIVGMAVGIIGVVLAFKAPSHAGAISTGFFSMLLLDLISLALYYSYALSPLYHLMRAINDTGS
jgi:hypothetical protein